MFVVLSSQAANQTEVGIDKRYLRKRRHSGRPCRLCEKHGQRQEVWVHSGRAEWAKIAALRCILEVVGPGQPVLVHQVEDRSGDRLVPTGWRKNFGGGEMSERR